MTKTTIVTTTIRIPTFLTAYADNVQRNGHQDVDIIVVGDTKSDIGTREFCAAIPNCEYLGIIGQEDYLARFPKLLAHIPYASVSRRNIGILKAYEQGADVIVTLDDDNLIADPDPVKAHQVVGKIAVDLPLYRSNTGWHNVCNRLEEENDISFYHRGYPPSHRWQYGGSSLMWSETMSRVVVNAGLWLGNPDVDAVTRLERPLNVTGYVGKTFGLLPGTWSPFNCQNTALARKVIPAYFMSPYIGRHDDIFASYIVTRLAEHFGDVIAFGTPLSNHQRSPHDLWKDLDQERWGMQNTDFFCDVLRNTKITAGTYHEGFRQIIAELDRPHNIQGDKWIGMVRGMEIWHEVFKEIL